MCVGQSPASYYIENIVSSVVHIIKVIYAESRHYLGQEEQIIIRDVTVTVNDLFLYPFKEQVA